MSFNDIKGHAAVTSHLKSGIRNGTLANAYIFRGPVGVGKKLTAINFAKAVNCQASDEGCDNCPSCKKIDSLNHPDVRLVIPEKEGGSIKIDDIRAVIRDTGLKPYEARKKVYIIDGAASLTEEAENALLKTLEEPSPDSILILITESPEKLFPTIRSRCQIMKFFPLDTAIIEDALIVSHNVESIRAHVLARISCGSLGTALKLRDENFFNKRERVIRALSDNALSDMEFGKISKSDLTAVLNIMLTWYRDILTTKAGGEGLVNIDKKDLISTEALRMDFDKLDNILKRIISTQVYLDQNANPRLAMAALSAFVGV